MRCFVKPLWRPYNRAMISQLTGKVVRKTSRTLVLDVGGVGYEVMCIEDVLIRCKVGSEVTLATHLNVREDLMELYGFMSADDLGFFKLLLGVSGIGPKSALNILEVVKPADIRRAVATQDPANLHAVHGLGKKTAEKLVIELKDKLDAVVGGGTGTSSDEQAVLEAIINLGYSAAEARSAVKAAPQSGSLEERVKAVLKQLARA